MAQKFLSIKNFEKYQSTKKREGNRPWVKLWKSILNDPEVMKLNPHDRFVYIGLILLADDTNNKVYADSTYLRQRLYMTHTEGIQGSYIGHTQLDLRSLYRSGLLSTSNLSRTLSEAEGEKRRGREEAEAETNESAHAARSQPVSDEAWMDSLRVNPGYSGIDIDTQRARCEAWCQTNGKAFGRRRFINWLNRTDKPMSKPDWKEAFLRDEN